MKMHLAVGFCVLSLVGCYVNVDDKDKEQDHPSSPLNNPDASSGDPTVIEASGYVVSAFDVTVDGVSYSDLENFYTKELERLPERMKEAGYDESYSFEFDAKVGFEDLWQNMTVYLLASGKTGYQAKTYVNDQGGFKTFLPLSEEDTEYKIRAIKRINIKVSKGEERRIFCYNFSAKEKAARFQSTTEPIILADFVSEITSYDCSIASDSGIIVPERP